MRGYPEASWKPPALQELHPSYQQEPLTSRPHHYGEPGWCVACGNHPRLLGLLVCRVCQFVLKRTAVETW